MNAEDALSVLVVADHEQSDPELHTLLADAGYACEKVVGGDAALDYLAHIRPTAVVLNMRTPGVQACDFIAKARVLTVAPIIVLHQNEHRKHALDALEAGADDCAWAFPSADSEQARREFLIRLDAAVRVANRAPDRWVRELVFGNVRMDLSSRRVFQDGQPMVLTGTEYRVLEEFLRNAGRLLTADELLERVWGENPHAEVQYVRVYVHRVRKRLGWDGTSGVRIETQRGRGYLLTTD